MSIESIGASVYSIFQIRFYETLFQEWTQDAEAIKSMTSNYPFVDFF
jgi:hypothetical protein